MEMGGSYYLVVLTLLCLTVGSQCQILPAALHERQGLLSASVFNPEIGVEQMQFTTDIARMQKLVEGEIYAGRTQMFETSVFRNNSKYDVSQPCLNQTIMIVDYMINSEKYGLGNTLWAWEMFDATAKVHSGILNMALIWPGQYSQCRNITTAGIPTKMASFDAQHCTTNIGKKSKSKSNLPGKFSRLSLTLGVCVPGTCSNKDVEGLMEAALSTVEPIIKRVTNSSDIGVKSVHCPPSSLDFDAKAVIALTIVIIIFLTSIAGTLYDVAIHRPSLLVIEAVLSDETTHSINQPASHVARTSSDEDDGGGEANANKSNRNASPSPPSGSGQEYTPLLIRKRDLKEQIRASKEDYTRKLGMPRRVLLAFSVYTNGAKIMHAEHGTGSLECLHGIRFLSLSWVILGHSYLWATGMIDNIRLFGEVTSRLSFQVIINATFCVDSFFVLSGLLVSYLFLKEYKKKGKINFLMFYFHRFWRLTPAYMLLLMVDACLYRYTSEGPFWSDTGMEPYCSTSWWTNLLYINNFVYVDKMCMGWSWYLSNDMQFYIITPLLLIPLFKSARIGCAILLTALVGSWTVTGIISNHYKMVPNVLDEANGSTLDDFKYMYVKPYCRIGPYLIGIFVGYILYRKELKFKMNKWVGCAGWAIATAMALAVVYGLYPVYNYKPLSQPVSDLYNALSRSAWGASVGWVMFACLTGNGGYVNTILSWKGWIPISRLTYCAYLVHPLVINWYITSLENILHYSQVNMVMLFVGFLFLSYVAAFISSLAFESPMMGLEKILLSQKKRKE